MGKTRKRHSGYFALASVFVSVRIPAPTPKKASADMLYRLGSAAVSVGGAIL